MDWWQLLSLILAGLLGLMLLRVPVAFAFFTVNIVGAYFLLGGISGLEQLVRSIEGSLTIFTLTPIPLFVLMGEIMFHAGMAPKLIDTLDKWIGRLPARLSLLAVGGGTALSTLTGASVASITMLGSTLLPDMERRGYKTPMTLGPILGSGGLAVLIPPSALGVLLASLGKISVGQFLIAIVIPGILAAALIAGYIVVRGVLDPELAPRYEVENTPLTEKLKLSARYILPLGLIVFLVIGLIILGVATPTEAAAMGALGSMILAALYRTLTPTVMLRSFSGTLKITTMILFIIAGSTAFSQLLSFTGVTSQLVQLVGGLTLSTLTILIIMQLIVLVMGTFMEPVSIMLIVLPIFIPVAQTLGFDLLWFATLLLINIELGLITPPFGLGLFAMKGAAPAGTSMGQIYTAAIPMIAIYLVLMALLIAVPSLTTWLPSVMAQ